VSTTVTVKLPVDVLPALSVAEQLTTVTLRGNVEPDAGEQVTGSGPSTLSVAVAPKVTMAPAGPVACAVMGFGTCNAGGVVSTTVTVKLPLAVLPAESVAEQVTVVVPRGKIDPDAREQVTGSGPSTLSVALAP